MRTLVALLALLTLLAGCAGGTAARDQASMSPTLPAALPTTVAAPTPAAADTALRVIPYRGSPPAITGIYPLHCAVRAGGQLPDPFCTPGAVGDRVIQGNIDQTICVPNWTDTLRPDNDADRVKTLAMLVYAIPAAKRSTTELDHLVPLGLGGADDTSNLWPQMSDIPHARFTNTKDTVERILIHAVCDRRITLAQARSAIVTDWRTARAVLHV